MALVRRILRLMFLAAAFGQVLPVWAAERLSKAEAKLPETSAYDFNKKHVENRNVVLDLEKNNKPREESFPDIPAAGSADSDLKP